MPVISFANSKGGSGKTTSALLLACELAQYKDTTLIDADPRRPITEWYKIKGGPDRLKVVTNSDENTILDEIEQASAESSFVIVDLEGVASRLTSYAISMSDLVIIPMKEQQQDAWAAMDVIKQIKMESRARRTMIPFSILFTQTRVVAKSRTARHIAEQFRATKTIPCLQAEINDRDAFSALFNIGGTIHDLKTSDVNNITAAKENANVYAEEVVRILRESKKTKEAA
ncbi:MAG: ParA family protein [Alphaproteobacteria bacterium]|nr:ParA family protein [Alphaproteobacteria bacterium]